MTHEIKLGSDELAAVIRYTVERLKLHIDNYVQEELTSIQIDSFFKQEVNHCLSILANFIAEHRRPRITFEIEVLNHQLESYENNSWDYKNTLEKIKKLEGLLR